MATISEAAQEAMATYVSELETERDSYKDEAAEWKLKYQSVKAELLRLRATLEVA